MFIVFLPTWYYDVPLHHLTVYQISWQSEYLFPLYGNFHTLTKTRKKTETIFESLYLGNVWLNLVDFGMWVLTVGGISTAKIVQFHVSSTKLHMHARENCIIVLRLIYSWCGVPASWAAWHTEGCTQPLKSGGKVVWSKVAAKNVTMMLMITNIIISVCNSFSNIIAAMVFDFHPTTCMQLRN